MMAIRRLSIIRPPMPRANMSFISLKATRFLRRKVGNTASERSLLNLRARIICPIKAQRSPKDWKCASELESSSEAWEEATAFPYSVMESGIWLSSVCCKAFQFRVPSHNSDKVLKGTASSRSSGDPFARPNPTVSWLLRPYSNPMKTSVATSSPNNVLTPPNEPPMSSNLWEMFTHSSCLYKVSLDWASTNCPDLKVPFTGALDADESMDNNRLRSS